jgi:hypothetical protein
LVAGVPLAAITAPLLVIDLVRYAPQEILLVGSMGLGAVLLVQCFDALLDRRARSGVALGATAAAGLVFWWFGVLQKETSLCVIVLAPFLWPTIAAQRPRWNQIDRRRRVEVGLLAGGILFPYFPLGFRTAQLLLAGVRPYPEATAAKSFVARFSDQLSGGGFALGSDLPTIIAVAAFVLLAASVFRGNVDWLSVGLLSVALAFLVAAAGAGVVVSRYYFPAIVLATLVLARSAIPLGSVAVLVTGAALVVGGVWQAWDSRGWTQDWVAEQRAQETLVREAAARAAGGCPVGVTGLNTEYVQALPVLMRFAEEPPRGCRPGERFVVVLDHGAPGDATPPSDPVLAACAPDPTPVWSSYLGKILRCTR